MGGLQTTSLPESRQLKTAESRAVAMKIMLEIPCHIPKDPPKADNSQFSCPYFSASITGVIKNRLAARADNKKKQQGGLPPG